LIRTAAAVLLALGAARPAHAADAPPSPYYDLHYAYEVAAYCGLAAADVERAFRAAREMLAARSGLDADALKRLRLRAIVAAAREYQNRGLGGYRPWCRREGQAARRRIIDLAPDG
jgi:hypothetical protein